VRLYQQRACVSDPHTVIDLVAAAPTPNHGRRLSAAAACVGLGVSLIGAGELMHRPSTPSVASATPTPTPTPTQMSPIEIRTVSDEPRPAPDRPIISLERGIIAVRAVTPGSVRATRPEPRRVSVKRNVRQTPATVRRPAPRKSRGVLDRLRLGWLRRAFTSHSDL
jgi:hypothetical protein